MQYVAALAIGLAVSLVTFMLLSVLFAEERRVGKRIENIEMFSAGSLQEAEPLAGSFADRILKPAASGVASILRSVLPANYYAKLAKKLESAGMAPKVTPDRILLSKLLAAAAGIALGVLVGLGARLPAGQVVLAAIVGAAFVFVPDLYLTQVAAGRQKRILKELPDMLDMLTISVQAGLGFDQAVTRYIAYSSGPLGVEFALALREIQAGKTRRESLREMADRAEVSELRAFIMAIVQADVFGVSISDVLRTQSNELRVKRRQKAEELAQKAPAKMSFPLIGCLMPATVIVVLAPAIAQLINVLSRM